jgi:hypothetical protein
MAKNDSTQATLPHEGWRLIVDLHTLTWGDMRTLVAFASSKDDGELVEFELDTDDIPPVPVGIIIKGDDGA